MLYSTPLLSCFSSRFKRSLPLIWTIAAAPHKPLTFHPFLFLVILYVAFRVSLLTVRIWWPYSSYLKAFYSFPLLLGCSLRLLSCFYKQSSYLFLQFLMVLHELLHSMHYLFCSSFKHYNVLYFLISGCLNTFLEVLIFISLSSSLS
jgi:hypothetical protein